MMHNNATIQDSLSPEQLALVADQFGLDLTESDYVDGAFVEDEWLEQKMGYVSSQYLWHSAWLYGIVVDNDAPFTDLYGFYHPEDDRPRGYYVPDDFDTEVSILSIDTPLSERCEESVA